MYRVSVVCLHKLYKLSRNMFPFTVISICSTHVSRYPRHCVAFSTYFQFSPSSIFLFLHFPYFCHFLSLSRCNPLTFLWTEPWTSVQAAVLSSRALSAFDFHPAPRNSHVHIYPIQHFYFLPLCRSGLLKKMLCIQHSSLLLSVRSAERNSR